MNGLWKLEVSVAQSAYAASERDRDGLWVLNNAAWHQ